MKKIKKIAASIMAVTAMATTMVGISASAVQEEEYMNPVEPESSSSFDGVVNWTETYANGELISATGFAITTFPLSNYSKSLHIMSTSYDHFSTSDSDHRLILENIFNTSGGTRYAAGTTYICDANFSIDWAHHSGSNGYILHSPVLVSTSYVKSGLSSGLHYATYSSCVYAANTPNAPVENDAVLYAPIS